MTNVFRILSVLLALCPAATLWAQNIAGDYDLSVHGSNVMLHQTPAQRSIEDRTTLRISQDRDQISMEFGSIGDVSAATLFKGKVGNNRFAAVWWYQGYSHETKVVWGTVHNNELQGRMIYPRVANRQGLVPGWVEVTFSAIKRILVVKPIPKAAVKVRPKGFMMDIREDCIRFNPRDVSLKKEGSRYLLTDGRSRMKVFPNREEGRQAVRTVRHYNLTQHCFVGRPDPSMTYFRN